MMTLEGAINFSESNNSTIYTMNSVQTGQYCVVIPKNTDGELSMLVDMNMKAVFDSLMSNSISKEELVKQINEEYSYVEGNYPHGILVLPMIDINLLSNAVISNDKQKMFDETKKIGGITSEIYKKLTDAGIDKNKINQKIMIIEKNDNDIKFVEWLKTQMPNFVDGVSLESLKPKAVENVSENSNPFANVNPFTGEVSSEPEKQDTVVNDIFGTSQTTIVTQPEVSPTPVPVENNNVQNDIFANPASVAEQPVQMPENIQNIIEPQPVQNTSLNVSQNDNVSPVQSQVQQVVTPSPMPEQVVETSEQESNLDKKSGGFANLLILVIILIVVTVASIELGKFLYSTFGA